MWRIFCRLCRAWSTVYYAQLGKHMVIISFSSQNNEDAVGAAKTL